MEEEIKTIDLSTMTEEDIQARVNEIKELLTKDMEDDVRQSLMDELNIFEGLGLVDLELSENSESEPELTEEPVVEEDNTEIQNDPETVEVKTTQAVVSGCARLNVRKEPSKEAEVLCVIDEGTELSIPDSEESYEDFYEVLVGTETGIVKGYCMKQFISIK